jgi:hypothetical protein
VGPLRTLAAILVALCFTGTAALGQSTKARTVYVQIGLAGEKPYPHALVIPAGSPLRLASTHETDILARFVGRFTLSGEYRIDGSDDGPDLTFYPDRKSRAALPHWEDREVPEEMYIANASAFIEAVVPKDELAKLKARTVESVSGRVTMIADSYETSIDCDATSASARFVSVVKRPLQIASVDKEVDEC